MILSVSCFVFFLWCWFLVSVPFGQRKCLIWFQFSWISWGLLSVLSCGLSLKMFHVHLKRCGFSFFGMKILYISVKSISSRTLLNATTCFLIFCLKDLSIFDSEVLKSPTVIVFLSISFLKSSKVFFMYLGAPMLGAYLFTMFVLWVDSSFEYYEVTFWVSLYGPSLEVYFVWCEYCYSCYLFLFICLENLFLAPHFQAV